MARSPVWLYAVLLSHSPYMDMMTLFPSFFFRIDFTSYAFLDATTVYPLEAPQQQDCSLYVPNLREGRIG